jgi:cysteine desulfurase
MIYLDYQSTTPLAPEAFEVMKPWLTDNFANPHSTHKMGRAAAAAVEVAREQIAALLPKGGRVIFTSGATEAINTAISGFASGAIVSVATEHAAVLDSAAVSSAARILEVNESGMALNAAERGSLTGACLVCAMLVNNEIGVVQPIEQIAKAAHAAGALFLCDAVQAFGRMPIPDCCDMVAVSAHKMHGPKGIGALWVRDGVKISPLLHGGGQELGLRSGTLSPALCAGFGAAAALAEQRMEQDAAHVELLWNRAVLRFKSWTINGSVSRRYKGNLNIRCDGIDAARLISECRDVMFSAGSACASGSGRPSHVLSAIGLTEAQAKSSIRLGFGRYTRLDEIDAAADIILKSAEGMQ